MNMKYTDFVRLITLYAFSRYQMGMYDDRGDYLNSDKYKGISEEAFDKIIEGLQKLMFDK